MKIIIIDSFTETREIKKKPDKEPFIWLTTHKYPREQKKRGDKEPFIYLPSDKNQRAGGLDVKI